MCTPLRSPKMYGFILGFQRWVWWPKCAPASSNCCMETSLDAMVFLLPVMPLRGREAGARSDLAQPPVYDGPACGMRAPLAACAPEINPAHRHSGLSFLKAPCQPHNSPLDFRTNREHKMRPREPKPSPCR